MIECENCNSGYDPIAHRWLCPVCHFKGNCCEGSAQPVRAEWGEVENEE